MSTAQARTEEENAAVQQIAAAVRGKATRDAVAEQRETQAQAGHFAWGREAKLVRTRTESQER